VFNIYLREHCVKSTQFTVNSQSQGVIIIQFTSAVTIISVLDGVACHIVIVNSVQHALGRYHSVT